MKKLLISLLMLCSITAAWAGDGNGSKEKPFTGEWTVNALYDALYKGAHLDYNCVVKGGDVRVTDSKLDYPIILSWRQWAVGTPISKDAFMCYNSYCKYNDEDDRKKQTFIVTDFELSTLVDDRIFLSGYYSGFYSKYEAEGYIPVATADELKSAIQGSSTAKVHLVDDIDISGIGKIRDNFSGIISGVYERVDLETGVPYEAMHILKGKNTIEDKYSHPTWRLFDTVNGATFEGILFGYLRVSENEDDMGIIAKTASNSQFRDLIFASCSLFNDEDYVGCVVGSANKCSFVNIKMQTCDVTTDASWAGAIVGKSEECEFTDIDCGTEVYIFADGGPINAYSGGITGYSVNDKFTRCSHMGLVAGNSNFVGGMTGYSEGSDFLFCTNAAMVAHCKGDIFSKIQKDRAKELAKLDKIDAEAIAGYAVSGGVGATVTGGSVYLAAFLLNRGRDQAIACAAREGYSMYSFLIPAKAQPGPWYAYIIPEILIAATAMYLYYEATGDDYAGGIAGYAENGTIEQCANYGLINAIDKFVGGIAGYTKSMVINNCLNSAKVNQDRDCHWIDGVYRAGGIIGGGRDNTKVTNCLTTTGYPISGARSVSESERLDQTSGNNYSFDRSDYDSRIDFLEKQVSKELLGYGIVASWLNNGVENREKGIRPWRQNLWVHPGYDGKDIERDRHPVLDATHDEVDADLFYGAAAFSPYVHRIHDADGLKAFADFINSGTSSNERQFHIGYLENDIDMAGVDWTPIGKDEDFKNFRGIFNGRGHKITGLTCSSNKAVGLIGTAYANAVICNVTVGDGSSFTCNGEAGAGGIVGKINIYDRKWGTVVIENCGSHANINGDKHAGGILGRIEASANENIKVYVNNCYSTGTVTARYGNSALLCGYTQHSGVVSNSWSSGQLRNGVDKSIWPYSIENDKHEAECLVGYSNNTIKIKDCYIVNPDGRVDQYNKYKDQYPLQAGVEIIRERDLERGYFAYQLNGETNDVSKSLIWQQELGKDSNPTLGSKGLYHTREIQKDNYGTVCLPYQLKSDEDVAYYTFVGDETENGTLKLKFEYAETVPAAVPAIFLAKKDNDKYYFPGTGDEFIYENVTPKTESQTPGSAWSFRGYFSEVVINNAEQAQYVYYLTDNAIRNSQKLTISPFCAFFQGPSINELTAAGAKAIMFTLGNEEGTTTDLKIVGNDLVPVQRDGKTYSLMGTQVGTGYRGIVIQNGKKYVR